MVKNKLLERLVIFITRVRLFGLGTVRSDAGRTLASTLVVFM